MFNPEAHNTAFMREKFSVKTLFENYKSEIKSLRPQVKTPLEETKLQYYFQAADTIGRTSLKDKVQFALTLGRGMSGRVPSIRDAFPTLLGNRVNQPTPIDFAYAQLLLAYAIGFNQYKTNIKDWMLNFVINSRFSPVKRFIHEYIDYVISDTQHRVHEYTLRFGIF